MVSKEIAVALLGIVAAAIGLLTAYIARNKRHEVKIYAATDEAVKKEPPVAVVEAVGRHVARLEDVHVPPNPVITRHSADLFNAMITCSLPKKPLELDYNYVQAELTINERLLCCRTPERTILSLTPDQVRFGLVRTGVMKTFAAEPYILLGLASKESVTLKFARPESRDAAMHAIRAMAKRDEDQWG